MSQQPLLKVEPSSLAWPLAQLVGRVNRAPRYDDGETWLNLLYLMEAYVKLTSAILQSTVYDIERDESNHIGALLARANSIGEWSRAIDLALAVSRRNSRVEHLTAHRSALEATRQELAGAHLDSTIRLTKELLQTVGDPELRIAKNLTGVIRALVAVRNATRGHGAVPSGQYPAMDRVLSAILDLVLANDLTTRGQLIYLQERTATELATCLVLQGPHPASHTTLPLPSIGGTGLWFQYPIGAPVPLGPFLHFDSDRMMFYFANGAINTDGEAEFIDYVSGQKCQLSLAAFSAIPAERAPSSTQGQQALEYTETVAHNLPEAPLDYVHRPQLEQRLLTYLTDSRNRLITLQGPGGAGKTSVALTTVHRLVATNDAIPFDVAIWCSARDLDLLEGAPRQTRRAVSDLQSIGDLFASLTELSVRSADSIIALARALESPDPRYLLVLDNFETVDSPDTLYAFFNDHVTLPNRVLITARQRGTSGDQVLPVSGMEPAEAAELINIEAVARGIGERVTSDLINRVYDATAGNPYAMKLVVAQFTNTKNLDEVLRRTFARPDLREALCQRAFDELDQWGAYLFLLLGVLQFDPLESLLHIAAAHRGFVFDDVRQSLLDRSLAEAGLSPGGERVLAVSGLHQAFARRQLVGSQHEAIVREDARFLSALRPNSRMSGTDALVDTIFERAITAHADGELGRCHELVASLEAVSLAAPEFLITSARLAERIHEPIERLRARYRAAVEWNPEESEYWLAWAAAEQRVGTPLV